MLISSLRINLIVISLVVHLILHNWLILELFQAKILLIGSTLVTLEVKILRIMLRRCLAQIVAAITHILSLNMGKSCGSVFPVFHGNFRVGTLIHAVTALHLLLLLWSILLLLELSLLGNRRLISLGTRLYTALNDSLPGLRIVVEYWIIPFCLLWDVRIAVNSTASVLHLCTWSFGLANILGLISMNHPTDAAILTSMGTLHLHLHVHLVLGARGLIKLLSLIWILLLLLILSINRLNSSSCLGTTHQALLVEGLI